MRDIYKQIATRIEAAEIEFDKILLAECPCYEGHACDENKNFACVDCGDYNKAIIIIALAPLVESGAVKLEGNNV